MDPEERKRRLDLFLEDIGRSYDVAVDGAVKRLAEGQDPVEVVRRRCTGASITS
jgi:hypothetical protein